MLGRHKVLGKRGLKDEGRAGGKPDAAKAFGRTFAERKSDRRREQITSRRDYMLRNVASTSDANLQAKEAIAD